MKKLDLKTSRTALALCALVLSTFASLAHADPAPFFAGGFHDESEAGIVVTGGNSSTQSYNFKTLTAYDWEQNTVKLSGKYLNTSANSINTAQYWTLGLRYERSLLDHLSVFAAQAIESDVFSGYLQRYNSDLGGKYYIYKEDAFYWDVEAGYRYTIENRFTGHKTFSTKADVEFLPNLTTSSDYQINTDISVNAALNDVFAIKVGYGIKYRNTLITPAIYNTDSQFTTALVAKL
jgi:putative salt-induced outer membrane protein YdiY